MASPTEISHLAESREDLLREAQQIAEASGKERAEEETGPARSFLVCAVGAEWYAVDLTHVRRVLRPSPIARVSGAAPEVLGLMNCQGEVLCVLDLQKVLGTAAPARRPATEGQLVVVMQQGEKEAGFLVDSVEDVWEMASPAVLPVLESLDPAKARLFEGTVVRGGRFVGLLAPSACLNP